MARVLADSGYADGAAGRLAEALEEALGALGDSVGQTCAAPIPLARIRAELAPLAGLGDDTLALLAILREDSTTTPAGALERVARSLERIGTAIERQSLE